MIKRKISKSVLSVVVCLGLTGNMVMPVMATETLDRKDTVSEYISGRQETENLDKDDVTLGDVTPEIPKIESGRHVKVPVGGVEKYTEIDFTEKKNQVSILGINEGEVNGFLEKREEIQAGRHGAYGYNSLSEKEKKVYNVLLKSMISYDVSKEDAQCVERNRNGNYYAAGKVDVSSYKMTKSQMERIYFALEADYLEFFWLDDTIGWEYSGLYIKSWYIMVESDYRLYSTRKAVAASMEKGMKPFLEKIDNARATKKSEMELELLIHDMIIEEVDYAYDNLGGAETATFAHSIVGVFDNNSATDVVCEGYAKAFQYLCGYAGLDSIYAIGYSTSGGYSGGHAWNLIKIDGKWYNVDLTWNDENGSEYDGYIYDYYNLPTHEFNKNGEHEYRKDVFGGMYSVPNAVSTEASYYDYFGMNISAVTVERDTKLLEVLEKAVETNKVRGDNLLRFQCDDAQTLEILKSRLKDSVFTTDLMEKLNGNGVVYKIDSVTAYTKWCQLLVSVEKVYVENVCDGYAFGNPKEQIRVYQWKKREKEDITSKCDFGWEELSSKEGRVTVKRATKTLGTYQYTLVNPKIEKISSQEYTGNGICPTVIVSADGNILRQNEDYTLEYSDNRAVGNGKIIIRGMGNYAGELKTTFAIVGKRIENLKVSMSQQQYVYTGKMQKPEILVKDGSETLWEGKDYTLSYENNVKIGMGKVIVAGKGNYQGSQTVKFYIVPMKVSGIKLKTGSGKTLKFSYEKQTGVSGYEVSLYQGSKKVKVADTTKLTYQFKGLKENTQYTFKVRAYVNADGKKYGSYSTVLKVKTATKAPESLRIVGKNKSADLTWKKTSGATGYEVYMSNQKSAGFKKVATISKVTKVKYTKKKLSPGKTYYFKVRSYTVKNKGKVYSGFSTVKKVTVKKYK